MRIKVYCEGWKDRQPSRIVEVTLFPKVGEILELGRREKVEILKVARVAGDRRLDAVVHVKEAC